MMKMAITLSTGVTIGWRWSLSAGWYDWKMM
jgi:hypothetical protein